MATTIGKLVVFLNSNTKGFRAGFRSAGKVVARFRKRIDNFGTAAIGLGTKLTLASAAMSAPILLAARSFAKFGDDIAKTARRTGFSVKAISELGHVAELTGVNLETLEKGIFGLQRAMFDAKRGSAEVVDALIEVGLTYTDLKNLSPEEQFVRMADALKGIENPALRGAVAQKLFGRSGRQLLPLLDLGAEGLAHYRAELERLAPITIKDARAAEELTDMVYRMKLSWQGLKNTIASIATPALVKVTTAITNAVAGIRKLIAEHPKLVTTALQVAKALAIAGAGLIGFGIGAKILARIISPGGVLAIAAGIIVVWSGALGDAGTRFADWVRGITIGGRTIAEWAGTIAEAWAALIPVFEATGSGIVATFEWIWTSIKAGADETVSHLLHGFANAFQDIANELADMGGILNNMVMVDLFQDMGSAMDTAGGRIWENLDKNEAAASKAAENMAKAWKGAGVAAEFALGDLGAIGASAMDDIRNSEGGRAIAQWLEDLRRPFEDITPPDIAAAAAGAGADVSFAGASPTPGALEKGSAAAYSAGTASPYYRALTAQAKLEKDQLAEAKKQTSKLDEMIDITGQTTRIEVVGIL